MLNELYNVGLVNVGEIQTEGVHVSFILGAG